MRALERRWRSWWREWKTLPRSVKCRVSCRWRVTCTVRRSVSGPDVCAEAWCSDLNPLWHVLCSFLSQQGLWVCHGSNITASITRGRDSWSCRPASRSLRLSRCFAVQKKGIIVTDEAHKHLSACNTKQPLSNLRPVSVFITRTD